MVVILKGITGNMVLVLVLALVMVIVIIMVVIFLGGEGGFLERVVKTLSAWFSGITDAWTPRLG